MTAPARTARSRESSPACCGLALVALVAVPIGLVALVDNQPGVLVVLVLTVAGIVSVRAYLKQQRADAQYRLTAAQSVEVARYHAMNPAQFEHAIAFLCQRDGCRDVRVDGRTGDLGADVTATTHDGRKVVIQCKRYGPTTKVTSPDVQRFGGTCWSVHRAQIAAVVTTSVFTQPAAAYAEMHGIRCVGAPQLAAWATRTGPPPWA
ncbi:hypothetical protein DB35_12400 [Streptomyces abyssalis]|uniref:Restriction endonuclease type IV Mrr domain-containing protein n=1 Tax=Streptomyces abyssalis TaxID=933944 RepID=A0A1E7JH19_9ACTN|nr:restriction endonuclease [Streptomyces abyssalis]OEU85784.1 hypothetical protein AN215_25545 [Streptomyces abyssalis]OEU92752.1 hypothetical protein DB35_12400 [Streptomyces abyssalis]